MDRVLPHPETVVFTAVGQNKEFTIKGRNDADLLAQRFVLVSHDEGLITNSARTVLDLEIQMRPRDNPDALYSGQFVPFAARAGQADGRNAVPMVIDLRPGQDLDCVVRRGNGGADTVKLFFERILIFKGSGTKVDPRFLSN